MSERATLRSRAHAARPAAGQAPGPAGATPLWAAYAFTFLSSIGTGVVTSGVYFLTREGYGFTTVQNYGLGVAMGVSYIAGAVLAGPATGALRRRFAGASTRAILSAIVLVMALLCAVPEAAARPGIGGPGAGAWPIWLTVVLYNPLAGALWPIIESYVSGGRPGEALRRAVSRWNVVWSAALVAAFWGLAPLVEAHGGLALAMLGVVHLGSLALLPAFGREPGAHDPGEHGPHPESYPRLLAVFRLLLPTSFMVLSALSPYLPWAMARLGVPAAWGPVVASAWLVPRVAAFAALDRWQRWHGSWGMPIVGGVLLLAGFAMCILAPLGLDEQAAALASGRLMVLVAGLGVFGVGVATIYAGAVYYALEVGRAEVDAGGTHESLIGLGYTVGPLFGLGAAAAAQSGLIQPSRLEWAVLGPVAGVAIVVGVMAFGRACRGARSRPGGGNGAMGRLPGG